VITFEKVIGIMELKISYEVSDESPVGPKEDINILEVIEPWYNSDIWDNENITEWQRERIMKEAQEDWEDRKAEIQIERYLDAKRNY